MKKFLTALLIGAFVFGVGSADISTAKAASDKNQSTHDKFDKNRDGDSQRPPEPPKDENGNPMPPPNHDGNGSDRNGDNQRPPEPPKDENGNPMPPPNHDGNSDRNGDNQNRPAPPNHDGNNSNVRK